MPEFETVNYSIADGVCCIELNRPDCLNAMNTRLIKETAEAFKQANMDDAARVIVFTGAGRGFCAGDDRNAHSHPENQQAAYEFVTAIQRVTKEIVCGEKIVVGAINGWAVGGGFEWAINCDFPIWAENAKGFFPEVSLNLFVTGAVTTMLPALVGLSKAKEMLILGETYTAKELFEIGVAWKVVDDGLLMDTALETASKIAKLPVLSSRRMKQVLNQTALLNIDKAIELETDATVTGFMDPLTTKMLKDF